MITLGTTLKYYKRKDVRDALVEHALNREVGVRYGDSFGSRPDILQYAEDVLEFVKKGAMSFHCSEERWISPLQLSPNMRPRELDELRMGWDLVLDVDCKDWDFAKLITHALIRLLRGFGISSLSVKFSGNKGFHIGVPFEAFPKKIHGKDVQMLFPDGPRRIATYLIYLLGERFAEFLPKNVDVRQFLIRCCTSCGAESAAFSTNGEFICPNCDAHKVLEQDVQYLTCEKCSKLMIKSGRLETCERCGKHEFKERLDTPRIMEIDTLLISSRHLYRAPYSIHEKSGLVSIPINPDEVLAFDKKSAIPEDVIPSRVFLSRGTQSDEAAHLFIQAFDFTAQQREEKIEKEIEVPETAIPAPAFPACIQKISQGLADGRKRAVFVLINFLRSCGWSADQVDVYLREWNERNQPPLRENYIVGQLSYAKRNKPILPPNCNNLAYYSSLGVKCAEGVCSKCKNPVVYAKRRVRYSGKVRTVKPDLHGTVPPVEKGKGIIEGAAETEPSHSPP